MNPSQLTFDVRQQKDIIGKITYHQQLNVNLKNRDIQVLKTKKVLILLTGGTIAMFLNQKGKYAPVKQKFIYFLQNYPYFCFKDQTYFNSNNDFFITPPSIAGIPIFYKYQQLDDLIDSTDMNIKRINLILQKIQSVYNEYDAFVILHGTDTMAYTASALSFMIQNLKKTIVITGSQIPMSSARNDAVNNLLSSLTIAGHYIIPQVLVVFDNKILRGNRSTKFSTSSFQSFKSPNFGLLGQLGLQIKINWQEIIPCNFQLPTTFIKLSQQVEIQKLTPYGYQTTPTSKYVVIESFGIGNVPTQGPFFQWATRNSKLPQKEQKILINVSQVFQSVIKNIYETGQMAYELKMIPSSDMTCQAAIAKLSYLVSKGYKTFPQLNQMMTKNLRGQLTQQQDRFTQQKSNYILNCMTVLDRHFKSRSNKQKQILVKIIFPTIVLQKPSHGSFNRLIQYNTFDPHQIYTDGSNLIHRLMRVNHQNLQSQYQYILDCLLSLNVKPNLIDTHGNSAAFYGIQNKNYTLTTKLLNKGGIIKLNSKKLFSTIIKGNLQLLNKLHYYGYQFNDINFQGRNCLIFTIINQTILQQPILLFFKNSTNLFHKCNLQHQDIYGKTYQYYVQHFKLDSYIQNCQQNDTSHQTKQEDISKNQLQKQEQSVTSIIQMQTNNNSFHNSSETKKKAQNQEIISKQQL